MKGSRPALTISGLLTLFLSAAAPASAQGNRWEAIGQKPTTGGFPPINVYQLAFGADDTLLAANSLGIFESPGDGTWQALLQTPWFEGFPPYLPYYSILVEPGSPSSLVAGVSTGGVIRSTDGGRTWSAGTGDGGFGFLSMAGGTSSPRVVYASVKVAGSFATSRSDDFGATWTGLPALDASPALVLAVDPASSDVVYAVIGPSSAGRPAGIEKSSDAGQSWTRLTGGLPDDVYWALAVDASGTVYAGSDAHGVLRSEDGGASWAPANEGLGSLSVRQIVADPTAPARLFAGTTRGVYRSEDRGDHWGSVGFHLETITSLSLDAASSTLYAGLVAELGRIALAPVTPCTPGPQTLCLNGGRFRVEAIWRGTSIGSGGVSPGADGVAQASPITDDTGAFWFFDAANLEVVVKILDGGGVNGDFWVFYGALSNLEYVITVTDTETGIIQSYYNPGGSFCPANAPCPLASVADTGAFPSAGPAPPASRVPPPALPKSAAAGPCVPDGRTLCQVGGRFQVRAEWQGSPSGPTETASAVALTDDTGYFWFFDASNVELVVKTLDGTAVNGHDWVFSGGLSNVYYRITVTDLETGAVRTYENPFGRLASFADTAAF